MCLFLIEDSGEEIRFSHLKFLYNNYFCIRRIEEGAAAGTNESMCPYLSALEECPDYKVLEYQSVKESKTLNSDTLTL